jgi:hypothetical protein
MNLTDFEHNAPPMDDVLMYNKTSMPIYSYDQYDNMVVNPGPGPYAPRWLVYPVLKKDVINLDAFKDKNNAFFAEQCIRTGHATLSTFSQAPVGDITSSNKTTARIATLRSFAAHKQETNAGSVFSTMYLPIFDSFGQDKKVVALLSSLILWRELFFNILPDSVQGITVVLENTCSGNYTYEINGAEAIAVGEGDMHDRNYEKYAMRITLGSDHQIPDGTANGIPFDVEGCSFNLKVYPSQVSFL